MSEWLFIISMLRCVVCIFDMLHFVFFSVVFAGFSAEALRSRIIDGTHSIHNLHAHTINTHNNNYYITLI